MPTFQYGSLTLKEEGAPDDLTGGAVIDGFPGTGLASAISSACLIGSLKLPMVGELRSSHFPPLATVQGRRAQAPARIYADSDRRITIFIGDFTPGQIASYEVASAMVDWARRRNCAFIVTSYSTPIAEEVAEHELTAIASDDPAEEMVKAAGLPLADLVAIGGTASRLLLEGREAGIPVISLKINAHKRLQDYEAATKLAEALMKLVPGAKCDLEALRSEAQRTEGAFRKMQAHVSALEFYK